MCDILCDNNAIYSQAFFSKMGYFATRNIENGKPVGHFYGTVTHRGKTDGAFGLSDGNQTVAVSTQYF